MARPDGATELLPRPPAGRTHSATRRVRLSDTTAAGELRLDALARYGQDIASDDARETMPDDYLAWVVRRSLIEVHHHPAAEEQLELTTWCSGYGGRWAERRTSVVGDQGGLCDMAMLWVAIDPDTGAPARLPPSFADAYGTAAQGRTVSARLQHAPAPEPGAENTVPWQFRVTDLDRLGHVNNAAYWSVVEEELACGRRPLHLRAEVEYREACDAGQPMALTTTRSSGAWFAWLNHEADLVASMALTTSSTRT